MNANGGREVVELSFVESRRSRRMLIMKRVLEVLGWLTVVALLAFAGHAVFAGVGQEARRPAPASIQRDERGAQEDSVAGRLERERRAREREDLSPASLMRDARTIYVAPTEHLDKKYLEYKLHKYRELGDWNLMLVADPRAADLILTIDKTALNYIFTITDAHTSVIVTSGKCVAVNGLVAAEFLGKEIINKIRDVRASDRRPRRKKHRDDDADDDASESSS
ncbi:MAG TPA: hypothetical protein VHU19_08500 [Pyrinomonadaceae bacterium]|nr:hypothetical protein [Pyrinomonadaceae bacterium]